MSFRKPVHKTDLSSGVCISAPDGDLYQAAAKRLQSALKDVLSDGVEILPDARLDAGGRHVIALGNMMDSAFVRTMYFRAYDLTDRVWPGPGGWVIRTAPDSLEDAGHVIVVGVSQAEGVADAAGALARTIRASGAELPFQYHVNLGRWADLYLKPAQDRLNQGDEELEREFTSGPGDWTYMWAISEIGMLAVQTGLEELIPMFCRQVRNFARTRWFERHLPDPPQIHGFLRTMLLPFTVLENHPGLPGDQREETLEAFLGLYRSTEGAGNAGFLSHVGVDRVRQNHQTMSGLDLFYGGRYFHQVHGLAEGRAWMKLAEVFFAPQMTSNKPVCDSWGHQWAFSLFNTADYALASGKTDYFTSKPYLEGVDRALVAHSNLEGGPQQYMLMAAAVTGNDEYLQLCGTSDEGALAGKAVRTNVEPFRAWVTGRAAATPERMGRVGVAPLSRLFYDSLEDIGGFAPEGVYVRDVPYEQTFDKVYFRSGWTDDDDYLLLCGISGGSHSYQDGNCIVRYTGRGKNWFGGRVGPASIRDHNGVSVAVDASGPGCESRYAALRYVSEGDRLSAAGTCMGYPGQADWNRHIVNSRYGWFLVIDEVRAKAEGEYLIECRWHVYGDVESSDGVLRAIQGDARLEMRHSGSGARELAPVTSALAEGGTRWVQRSLKSLEPGEGVRFATLFWSDEGTQPRTFAMSAEASGYRVEGEGTVATVSLSAGCDEVRISEDAAVLPTWGVALDGSDAGPFVAEKGEAKPAWQGSCGAHVTAMDAWEGGCFAGDDDGGITAFDRNGERRWTHRLSGHVRTVLALADGGVVAGGDGEAVRRLDASGQEVWTHQLEWQPMNWDYWTWLNCKVLSLASGDIDGDGRDEILAGCADRHVYAFDEGGALLWRSACQWGPPTCLAVARLRDGDGLHVLAGMADPSIHGCVRVFDARGACVKTLSRPDIMSWSIPSWSKCLRAADLNGDGVDEVLSGVDTNHRQLIVYGGDGEVLWDADAGGAVLSVAYAEGRIFAGASNGYVQSFQAGGRRLWHRFLAAPVCGLSPGEGGGCLVALGDGRTVGLDGSGEICWSSGGNAITAAAAFPGGGLLVGRRAGVVEYVA
ncbi:MAG: PQQ-binding-like beta-propeller repeat protein [Gemmatimonadota bacterium]|nr:PQQ-binding-like beta-propeller repeat protein [Gemmatimonadota bacterium]